MSPMQIERSPRPRTEGVTMKPMKRAGECSDEEYAMAGGEMTVWDDCANELHDALKGLVD